MIDPRETAAALFCWIVMTPSVFIVGFTVYELRQVLWTLGLCHVCG